MTVVTLDPGAGTGTGAIVLTPGFADVGVDVLASVRASDGILTGNVRTFAITVIHVNRAPTANAGGPYQGVPQVLIAFDGTASSDPDGEALTYQWHFGDLATAAGPTPAHAYAAAGVYPVTLTVSDGLATASAEAVATITDIFPARAFMARANRLIRLGSGKPTWSVQLEAVGHSYDNAEVDPASIRMKSDGTGSVSEIPALVAKTGVWSDTDGNGVLEITASFAKEDLEALFSDVSGQTSVPVTFEGRLVAGAIIRAQADVGVSGSKGGPAASVYPNPLNPAGWVSVFVPAPGTLQMRVFDARGRLVRTLHESYVTGPSRQEIAFNGLDDRGAPLSSGIYFLRITTAASAVTKRIAVVR
jgi:hypothetical protein